MIDRYGLCILNLFDTSCFPSFVNPFNQSDDQDYDNTKADQDNGHTAFIQYFIEKIVIVFLPDVFSFQCRLDAVDTVSRTGTGWNTRQPVRCRIQYNRMIDAGIFMPTIKTK